MSDRAGAIPADSVRVAATSGRVQVVAEERSDVDVRGRAEVRREGGRTTVDAGANRVEVRVPTGVDLVVGTSSGRVAVDGPVGAVAVVTGSGRVAIDRAASVDVRSASGRVEIGRVEGHSRVRGTSGRVTVERTAEADVATRSGRIELRSVTGRTVAHCVSGRIEIRLATAADVQAETVSGRIAVTVPDSVSVHTRTGMLPDGAPPDGADCSIATRSVSGRVTVETW